MKKITIALMTALTMISTSASADVYQLEKAQQERMTRMVMLQASHESHKLTVCIIQKIRLENALSGSMEEKLNRLLIESDCAPIVRKLLENCHDEGFAGVDCFNYLIGFPVMSVLKPSPFTE